MKLQIFTDSSQVKNVTCYGYIIVEDDIVVHERIFTSYEYNSSLGELMALIKAHEVCDIIDDREIEIVTDSDYCYNVSEERTLKNKKNKIRKNLLEIDRLIELKGRLGDRVSLRLVKSHDNCCWNCEIDKRVRERARKGGS